MKFRKLLYIFIALIVAFTSFEITDTYAAKRRTKAKTTAIARGKKSSKNTKSRKSKSTKAKNSKKGKRSTWRSYKAPSTPPQEVPSNDSLTLAVNERLLAWIPEAWNPGGLRVNRVKRDSIGRIAKVSLNENFTYLPVTKELIDSLLHHVALALPDSLSGYRVNLTVASHPLAYYITKVDKLPEQFRKNPPFVVEAKPFVHPTKGLENDIIALWHSHGRYFKSGSWAWQRPFLFQSIEDTYTMSYILPYVVPMLENAGAYVMLPRERDINRHEVIVDNDTNEGGQIYSQPYYKEMTGSRRWVTGDLEGFIYDLPDFRDTENPFENGTYRQTTTITSGKPSVAAWYADIPEDGEYAIYVSYKSFANSAPDAHYTVNYSGGSKEYRVNQTMGGGTWIYLGTFPLTKGFSDREPIVTLSNLSSKSDLIITADALKIGGGMGNIARSSYRSDIYYDPSTPEEVSNSDDSFTEDEGDDEEDEDDEEDDQDSDNDETGDTSQPADPTVTGSSQPADPSVGGNTVKKRVPTFRTSGLPRYLEGARYWLHWAGFPESIYSPYHGSDDYKDDYTSRGHWVNYLAGGSRVLPNHEGLNIPVDMSFALHTDAGKRDNDTFIGTLGIYYTHNGDSYRDGTPRINSRMLTDIVMRQITTDIRRQYEPSWTRRSMWDKSYLEARVAEVPTTLIELLSHQNFADMEYGLDPGFRFTVGRAIYKGIARFLGERKDREVVIQPLPVKDFAIKREKKNHYRLSWQPTPDPLEETAMPDKYVILGRNQGELGFHKIGETSKTHYDLKVADNEIHSFRVIAINAGGQSFPSETLALREAPDEQKPVLIINGFTRVSGPEKYKSGNQAGFKSDNDFGVPYIREFSYTGPQMEFNRGAGNAFGNSSSSYVSQVIAGNTFDYPALHGESIARNGAGFVSSSAGAVESGAVDLSHYNKIDYILGKQKAVTVGNGKIGLNHRTFSPEMQRKLKTFSDKGGKMMITGENITSDLHSFRYGADDRRFSETVLGVVPDSIGNTHSGSLRDTGGGTIKYSNTLNEKCYIVQHPDPLSVAPGMDGEPIYTFSDTGAAAGYLIRRGKGRNLILSVPFETITDPADRDRLMSRFLTDN